MASGASSDRTSAGPRSFGFESDDVLCAYDDFTGQDPNNGRRSDPSPKDFPENRVGRPLISVYGQQDEYPKEEIITAVEKCMKKYADNLLRHLEGISGRLSQLEIYCYKLERSIGEFRADMIRDQGEADTKLKSLEKHLHEVHRSIQILRDKQELAETQKELTKLQLAPKESTTAQKNEEAEPKQHDTADTPNTHLALALPHQVPPQPQYQPAPFYPQGPPAPPQYQHQQWSHPTSHQFAQQVVPPAQQPTPQPQLVPFGYGSSSQPQQMAKVVPYPPQSNMQGYGPVYNSGGFHQHQMMRSHPYADLIEKAASMGYPREHVVGVVNRMAESGQTVDFNALLDRLNSRTGGGGGPPRAWSG